MEHALTRTAAENDADFLVRVTRSWADAMDQDGAEPSEELLRQLQGAFIRRRRHGLHHLEIYATTEQFEHLLTVMNTGANPRTGSTDASPAATRPERAARRRTVAAPDTAPPPRLPRPIRSACTSSGAPSTPGGCSCLACRRFDRRGNSRCCRMDPGGCFGRRPRPWGSRRFGG